MTEPTTKPPLRFKHIRIEGLFGPENPDIEIPFNLDERVTILHGRNGSGKTICLGLIHALSHGDFSALAHYPFERVVVSFEPQATLEIRVIPNQPDTKSEHVHPALELTIRQESTVETVVNLALERISPLDLLLKSAEDRPDVSTWRDESGTYRWVVRPAGRTLRTRVPIPRLGGLTGAGWLSSLLHAERTSTEFIGSVQSTKYTRTDRLLLRTGKQHGGGDERFGPLSGSETVLMVDQISRDLLEEVQHVDREYRHTSTRLDSSLRRRLFEAPENTPTVEALQQDNLELNEQEQRLLDMGLLREAPDKYELGPVSDAHLNQHFILLRDRREKLAVFSTIVAKAQRLLESLNKKLAPKTVRLDVERGYEVRTAAGNVLPLESLSSGEQHELVLLHELLFDVPPGSLILIDEPELSLHVTWQKDLLPELLDIARIANLDFVLATHSPYIVGDRHDLMVRLGEPV
jgi:hypothetical protein